MKLKLVKPSFEWNVAMEREMQSLEDNKTWELVEHPQGQPIIDCN
jgi:hypothetical protein